MLFLTERIILLLIFLAIASYTDIKQRIVPDKISYSLISLGLIFNLIDFDFNSLMLSLIILLLGVTVYFLGKFGGGDIKIFLGITLILPFYETKTFIFYVLVFASLYSLTFYSVYYSLKLFFKKKLSLKNFNEIQSGLLKALLLGFILLINFFLLERFFSLIQLITLFLPLFLGLLFVVFQKKIKKEFFLKELNLNELDEDEVIAFEFLPENLKNRFSIKRIVTEKDKAYLKNQGINKIPVFREMPAFIPFVFLGCITALLNINLLSGIFLI